MVGLDHLEIVGTAIFCFFYPRWQRKEGLFVRVEKGPGQNGFIKNYQNETMAQVLFARFFLQEKARGYYL